MAGFLVPIPLKWERSGGLLKVPVLKFYSVLVLDLTVDTNESFVFFR